MTKIGIIGLGNMGQAIAQNLNKKYKLFYFDRKNKKNNLAQYCRSIQELSKKSEIIILSVKPQNFLEIKPELKKCAQKNHLIISIMAGINLKKISQNLKTKNIVRAMPNLALIHQQSLTGWVTHQKIQKKYLDQAQKIFSLLGQKIQCRHENQLDTITATAGSGPAYFLMIADLIYQFALKNNFSKKQAQLIAQQVLTGTAKYYQNQKALPSGVIKKITSKGGTTEAAFKYLTKNKTQAIILEAIKRAQKKSKQLSK